MTILLKDIKAKYLYRMNRKFAHRIEQYITDPIVQSYISKAMDYKLTREDYKWLDDNGGHKATDKYQYLYWLCCIYIHPLTILQGVVTTASRHGVKIF